MDKRKMKKLLILNLPYFLVGVEKACDCKPQSGAN